MMVQKSLLITELKNYVFRMEYLLMRYLHGLKLIYFCFESKLANAVMLTVRLTSSFFIILVYGAWSEVLETKDIEKLSNDVKDPDEAAKLINRMDKKISIKKNNTLTIVSKQGEIFKKFKTDNDCL